MKYVTCLFILFNLSGNIQAQELDVDSLVYTINEWQILDSVPPVFYKQANEISANKLIILFDNKEILDPFKHDSIYVRLLISTLNGNSTDCLFSCDTINVALVSNSVSQSYMQLSNYDLFDKTIRINVIFVNDNLHINHTNFVKKINIPQSTNEMEVLVDCRRDNIWEMIYYIRYLMIKFYTKLIF